LSYLVDEFDETIHACEMQCRPVDAHPVSSFDLVDLIPPRAAERL
jgi:hypothetical protein